MDNMVNKMPEMEEKQELIIRPIDTTALTTDNWRPVPADMMSWLRPLPDFLSDKAIFETYQGAVELVIPEGWENHQKFMNAPKLGTDTFYPEMIDGQIRRKAGFRFIDASAAGSARFVSTAFSIASTVTLQYYLTGIKRSLGDIHQEISAIQHFLQNDKLAKMESDGMFLMDTFKHMNTIVDNPIALFPTISTIQSIRRNTWANISLFREIAYSEVESASNSKNKNEKRADHILKAASNISAYWFAVQVYGRSRVLELELTQNYNAAYIQDVKADIEKLCSKYEGDYNQWSQRLRVSAQAVETGSWEYKAKQIGYPTLAVIAGIVGAGAAIGTLGIKAAGASVAAGVSVAGATAKGISDSHKRDKETAQKGIKSIADCSKVENARTLAKYIDTIEKQLNSPLHLAINGDNLYIKMLDDIPNPD